MTARATMLKGSRKVASSRRVVAKKGSIGVKKAKKSVIDTKTSPDDLETRIDDIDSSMMNIDEKAAPIELGAENNIMLLEAAVNDTTTAFTAMEKNIDNLALYSQIFTGIGAVGVLIFLRYALFLVRLI